MGNPMFYTLLVVMFTTYYYIVVYVIYKPDIVYVGKALLQNTQSSAISPFPCMHRIHKWC
jgi:hypothetical protein